MLIQFGYQWMAESVVTYIQNASRGLAADAFFSSSDLISKATKVSRVAKESPDNP